MEELVKIPFNKPFVAGKELYYMALQPLAGRAFQREESSADALLHGGSGDGGHSVRYSARG